MGFARRFESAGDIKCHQSTHTVTEEGDLAVRLIQRRQHPVDAIRQIRECS